ncbi:hypothetical protein E2F43_04680 [Seongchinamella unica]|uniref:Uncharacterized protein n=1 Tax=Seongchinamella unica TaxID=2547392 RepID=A0A4R5LVT6_9GAMM|nr:hypothetical protein [Seongchinamella unica]TDG15530.1 hypothetical protein E2F43_04680 [Seongchinamella unica]
MRNMVIAAALAGTFFSQQAASLSLAPEEFLASRQLACVLAEQSLGYLSETEYGARTHTVLDGFDDTERDTILAKALGYMDGLMFSIDEGDDDQVHGRLRSYVESSDCESSEYYQATVSL